MHKNVKIRLNIYKNPYKTPDRPPRRPILINSPGCMSEWGVYPHGVFFSWARWDWCLDNLEGFVFHLLNKRHLYIQNRQFFLKKCDFWGKKSPCGHAGGHSKLVFCKICYKSAIVEKNIKFWNSQNWVCLVWKLFPHPVGVFCTYVRLPNCHIMKIIFLFFIFI